MGAVVTTKNPATHPLMHLRIHQPTLLLTHLHITRPHSTHLHHSILPNSMQHPNIKPLNTRHLNTRHLITNRPTAVTVMKPLIQDTTRQVLAIMPHTTEEGVLRQMPTQTTSSVLVLDQNSLA